MSKDDEERIWKAYESGGFRPRLVGGSAYNESEGNTKIPSCLNLEEFMATFKTPDYIVDGIIQRGRLYALTSPTGHGKTAVAQYLGLQIASGSNIGYIEVVGGPVIFLAGENPDDLCCRMHAACQFYNMNPININMHVMPGNFPITKEASEELKAQIDESGINPVLIIIDTAAAYFPGDDDNSNVPMGDFARNLRILTTCNGYPAVLVPAHPVKDPNKENLLPRGGGGFLNELDGNLTLWGDPMGEVATLYWHGKLRGADFQPVNFALKEVKIQSLLDNKGRPIVSVVATLQTADQADHAARQSYSDGDTVLELMRRYPGITQRAIATEAGWVTEKESTNGTRIVSPHSTKVNRLIKALQHDKLVKTYRGKWVLTDAGKQASQRPNVAGT